MYRVKAFGAFPPISNNNPNAVAPLGELSAYCTTFALDRGIFKDITKPSSLLYSFASFNEISSIEAEDVPVPPSVSALLLEMMETLYTRATNGDFSDEEVPCREFIMTYWQEQVQNVVVNTMVTDGNRWLPSSIVFEGTSTTNPYQAQIWFSDDAFRNEYDLYKILVVPPIDNIDRFFDSATAVQAIVNDEMSLVKAMNEVAVVAGTNPYTQAVTEEFEWVDPTDPDRRILVPWTVVIYGDAGRNIDSIRQAISKWIIANSEYGEDQWQQLFPDIFGATEFVFTPYWPHVAIPDDAVNGGIYAPINNVQQALTMSKALVKGNGYTEQYIADNLNIMASVYKSVQVGVVGGYRNRDGVNQLSDRWPDYIALSTSSIDFARMSESTQKMILLMNKMFAIAETMTASSSVPRGFMRLIRGGILYVTASYERTSMIVTSRLATVERFPMHQGARPVEDEGSVLE